MVKWLPTKLEIFEERLTPDDVVAKDETTQAGEGAGSDGATKELGYCIVELCLYILGLLEYCIVELFYIPFAYLHVFVLAFLGLLMIMKYENMMSIVRIC